MKIESKVAPYFHALGREVGGSGQTVEKYLNKMDIDMRKRQLSWAVPEQQEISQKVLMQSIFLEKHDIVMIDNETYILDAGRLRLADNRVLYVQHQEGEG